MRRRRIEDSRDTPRRGFKSSSRLSVVLDNRSGYDTGDLVAFFTAGLRTCRVKKRVRVIVVAAPARSRGCAIVGGSDMVIALASPHRFRIRRLARLVEHEAAHLRGMSHEDMVEPLLYSLGNVPGWALPWAKQERVIRYRGRAPDQVRFLDERTRAPQHTSFRVRRYAYQRAKAS